MDAWPVLVFGAPTALLALLACVLGVIFERPWLLVTGGISFVPSSYALGGQPGLEVLFLLPLLPIAAAVALYRDLRLLACLLMLPNVVAVVFLTTLTVANLFG
jgi:hypothetical protein